MITTFHGFAFRVLQAHPIEAKLHPQTQQFSWWSYRAKDWNAADKGRRLDHVWASADIAGAAHRSRILRAARGWEQPSDHAPVFATFDL